MSVHDGYEKGFDVCLEFGKRGEHYVNDLFGSIFTGDVTLEVKTDDRWFETGNLYVEYQMQGRDAQWYPSGIATSEANIWAFVFSDTGVVLFVPRPALLYIARRAWRSGERKAHRTGQNPTRGVIISMTDLPSLVGALPFGDISTEPVEVVGEVL